MLPPPALFAHALIEGLCVCVCVCLCLLCCSFALLIDGFREVGNVEVLDEKAQAAPQPMGIMFDGRPIVSLGFKVVSSNVGSSGHHHISC